ncbi:hypothetical protein MMC14_003351 [Varicellaria rhodocarpa]|nr:hypothetical protein [Varicellaria rhodocarpa]
MYHSISLLLLPLLVIQVSSSPLIIERARAVATGIVGPKHPLIATSPVPTVAPHNVSEVVSPAATVTAPTTLVSNLAPTSPTYTAIVLQHHNVHRANHSAAPLTWSTTLATYAAQKANSCAWNEDIPSGAGSVGMNIASGTNLTPGSVSQAITSLFYNGKINNFPAYSVNNLNTNDPSFENWGHFSQVVWMSTTQVACYTTNCASSGINWFTACLYSPPGNFQNEFTQVGKPLGHPTVGFNGNTIYGLTGVNAGF